MRLPSSRIVAVLLTYLTAESHAYPMPGLPMYTQAHRDYPDEDYYYAPKPLPHMGHYYDTPAVSASDIYGHGSYPYIRDSYGNYLSEIPEGYDERRPILPVGQETWFEDESPHWQDNNDVNAAFVNNLILTQMAQDAEKHRQNAHAAFPSSDYEIGEVQRDAEDEDVRELKALAGKPLYHVPKTVPRIENEDDYTLDDNNDGDSFINWNGNKRSVQTTAAPAATQPKAGQKEVVLPGPGQTHKTLRATQHKRTPNDVFLDKIVKVWADQAKNTHEQAKGRKIEKRYVSGDKDLVYELRGLKHRIRT